MNHNDFLRKLQTGVELLRHEAYLWGSLDKVGSECSAGVPPEGAQEEAIIGVLMGNCSETKKCNLF